MAELTEDCCFNEPRDHCTGEGCPCGCHEKQPRMTRRQWETLRIADFERLENENYRLRQALQQIAWLADATEPLSVKAARIARGALAPD